MKSILNSYFTLSVIMFKRIAFLLGVVVISVAQSNAHGIDRQSVQGIAEKITVKFKGVD
jgi:hypothetical protein